MDWKETLSLLKGNGNLPEGDENMNGIKDENISSFKGFLHVVLDKKGRKGKTATIIEGLGDNDAETEELAKLLKQKLGTGGSWRTGEILLQGDCKTAAIDILKKSGYKIK